MNVYLTRVTITPRVLMTLAATFAIARRVTRDNTAKQVHNRLALHRHNGGVQNCQPSVKKLTVCQCSNSVILFTDIDECTSLPCQNWATCLDMVASYKCACADGFTGSHCETGA